MNLLRLHVWFLPLSLTFLFSSGLSWVRASQHSPSPEEVVRQYQEAKTREAALALLAPDYRLWFEKREGNGLTKSDVAKMLEWDFALRPRHRIYAMRVKGSEVIVDVHEDNDFSLLIGYPGWDATTSYRVNAIGQISEQVYVPRPGQPHWQPYLEKAMPWLRDHHPDKLTRLYPNGRLQQTAAAAKEWVEVLRDWRRHTGQSDPSKK